MLIRRRASRRQSPARWGRSSPPATRRTAPTCRRPPAGEPTLSKPPCTATRLNCCSHAVRQLNLHHKAMGQLPRTSCSHSRVCPHAKPTWRPGAHLWDELCRAWQEQVQRERGTGGLPVYAAALRCVPYVIPAHWAESPAALADELCSTTIHADPIIRQVRSTAMTRALRAGWQTSLGIQTARVRFDQRFHSQCWLQC